MSVFATPDLVTVDETHVPLLTLAAKTQIRIPLGDEYECPLPFAVDIPFAPVGGEPAGKLRALDAEVVTVYGITRGDAIAEGFRGANDFNKWWTSRHGGLGGHCWRIAVEPIVHLDAAEEQLVGALYGDDGRRPLFVQMHGATPTVILEACVERRLIQWDAALRGFVLSHLGQIAGRQLRAGAPL